MKKIIAMLLAVMMVLAMAACAAKQAETTTEASPLSYSPRPAVLSKMA